MAGLTLSHLYKRYDNSGKKKKVKNDFAVKDLNLVCGQGEFVALLGPSGCGKTTTLRMIAGLEDITQGDIFIGDRRVNDLEPKDRNIGLAFEDYAMYPPLTVYNNIAFNLRAKGVDKAEIDRRVREIAPLMQVEDILDMMPVKLSGGQKQRVNIARAIIRRPELLLMDEPLSHLDGKARQAMRVEIKRLINEIKCTTIYVTHDQLEAMSLADKIAIINFGVLQQFGTPAEVYDDPANEFVASFIGEPPMNILETTIVKKDAHFLFTFADSDLEIPVPERYYSVVSDGFRCKMGVRPMDLLIGDENSRGTPERIATFENLGDERRIGIRVGSTLMMLITDDEKRYRSGDIIRLEVRGEKTHLFDLESGERIREKG
ncbi:ABC transporter ATP-binding protein [Parablautia sp. Marseille-Q6255]|uniref:ABC transporter ATP-binding protein n=1 Tax=Parablautia sp. Marseille-Q6255 TaxID=3039593 RepID=UPI0024BCBED0|nr:ABC transporter ATP-binding protein [Parablautia sp. Marseille-Q6255]